ncbi:putative integral membrane protein (plasmid) [Streptomyces clavuligerus]|uniref:Putative integral membrane protein n=1 Tax=Streptomyces clavuligerus TaxID=1901 RepID=D5SJ54_STRCL|nr:putative integral membrane protein [Streptomyces clavuligerus]
MPPRRPTPTLSGEDPLGHDRHHPVFAHPDDESLLAGGVLARHADRGARTGVVTATWASDSPRAAELTDALTVLGAGPPRMLGYGTPATRPPPRPGPAGRRAARRSDRPARRRDPAVPA